MQTSKLLLAGLVILLVAHPTAVSAKGREDLNVPPPATSMPRSVFKADAGRLAGYSKLREKLLEAGVDPRASISILAAFTGGVAPLLKNLDESSLEITLPRFTLRGQACQAQKLNKIAATLKRDAVRRGPNIDLFIGGDIETSYFYARAMNEISSIVEKSTQFGTSCGNGGVLKIGTLPRWRAPLRIASTKDVEADHIVSEILAELKRKVPSLPIDSSTFPVDNESANVWLISPGNYDVRHSLTRCQYSKICGDIKSLIGISPGRASTSMDLFERSYLTEPYDDYGGRNVLVHVGKQGEINEAACGLRARGFPSALISSVPKSPRANLFRCITESLGASISSIRDVDINPDSEVRERIAISQLKKIYEIGD